MDGAKRAAGHAVLDDGGDGAWDRCQREQGRAIEMRTALCDLAQHDRREDRVLLDDGGNGGNHAIDFRRRRSVRSGDGLQALGGAGEHLAQQRAVQLPFAREVVIEHRLVHGGAAGDAVDAGAGVAALGELERGGMQDLLGRDAAAAAHSPKRSEGGKPDPTVSGALFENGGFA